MSIVKLEQALTYERDEYQQYRADHEPLRERVKGLEQALDPMCEWLKATRKIEQQDTLDRNWNGAEPVTDRAKVINGLIRSAEAALREEPKP